MTNWPVIMITLILLHSERPKLYNILAFLNATGLRLYFDYIDFLLLFFFLIKREMREDLQNNNN